MYLLFDIGQNLFGLNAFFGQDHKIIPLIFLTHFPLHKPTFRQGIQ